MDEVSNGPVARVVLVRVNYLCVNNINMDYPRDHRRAQSRSAAQSARLMEAGCLVGFSALEVTPY